MCIGVPMKVLSADALIAWCEGRTGREELDMLLVGPQPAGAWVLAFHGAARRLLSADEARSIDAALDALDVAMAGDGSAAPPDLSAFFPDLINREPQLPEHLRAALPPKSTPSH